MITGFVAKPTGVAFVKRNINQCRHGHNNIKKLFNG
jgi:hypothetical protein